MARRRRRLALAPPPLLPRSRTPPRPFLGSPRPPSLWRWAERVADLLGAGAGWVHRFAEALLRWGWFTRSARRVVDDAGRAGAVEAPPARRSGGADIDASAETRVPSGNGVAHHNAACAPSSPHEDGAARSQGGTEAVRDGDAATEEARGADSVEEEEVRGHDTATGQALVIAQEGARKEARGGELGPPPDSSAIRPLQAKAQPKRKKRGAGNGPSVVPRPQPRPRHRLPEVQEDPFEDGYDMTWQFNERADRDDEVALSYAHFCRLRSIELRGKKSRELCDICYRKDGNTVSMRKEELEDHCVKYHHIGFLCEQRGCLVRCDTLRDAGLHRFYLHQQTSRDWWRHLLEAHGHIC